MTRPTPSLERVRELGRGATSRVELARLASAHEEWPAGTEVAVKTLLPELARDERARAALEEEARAASEARHPSLVRALFLGEDERGRFLVLEYVPGQDLAQHLEQVGTLPEPRVRSIGSDLGGALAALHAANRVHGDLKLENVRLDHQGRAVLVDLGFSRRCEAPAAGQDPLERAGSLLFLSPETARGGAPTPASDVFALGILLHQVATGQHPFLEGDPGPSVGRATAEHLLARLAELHRERFEPPSSIVPELTPFFDQLLERALAHDPSVRPGALELARLFQKGESHSWWRDRVAREERGQGADDLPRAHLTPLVGRDRELELLFRANGSLRAATPEHPARGAVVWLSAPAGSGKSRLMSEFVARARTTSRPPLYLYGRASERRESRPLGTLLSLVRRWLQLPPGASIGPRGTERLNRTVAPREAEALAIAFGPGGGELAPALPSAIVAWLRALAEAQRLIVFVDDLHHAGAATISTLAELARELQTLNMLLVLGIRGEDPPTSPAALTRLAERLDELSSRATPLTLVELSLGPLEKSAVDELVDARFVPTVPRRRLSRLLWERSLGSPGLLAEMLRGLEARGDVEPAGPGDPRWNLLVPPDALPYPESLDRAIEARYEQLDEEARRWLARFSVIGGRISPEFVVLAFPDARPAELDLAFVQLSATGWLTPVGARYRFSRPALREAIYESLEPDERAALHSTIADALAKEDAGDSWETIFHRAHHLRQVGRADELLELLEPLFPEIPESGLPQRVLTLAQWAIEATERAPGTPAHKLLHLYETAVEAADRLGLRKLERELLDRMIELDLDLEKEPALAARVYLAHGRYALGTGQFGLARGWFANAEQFARRADAPDLMCEALRRLALMHGFAGDLETARAMAAEAIELAPDARRRAFSWLVDAQIAVIENRIADALVGVTRARTELAGLDAQLFEGAHAAIDMLRARIFRSAGRHGRALGAASRAVRRARRSGDRRLEVEASARLGGLEIDLDRLDEAEKRLLDARELAHEIEDKAGGALTDMWLGILLWERDAPEAGVILERTVVQAEEIGHHRLRAMALAVLARQRHSIGDSDAALETSRQAVELLERYGAELTDRIVIAGTRAMILRLASQGAPWRSVTRELRRRIRRESRTIGDDSLRGAQREYAERLLEAALSPEGPLYPRVPFED